MGWPRHEFLEWFLDRRKGVGARVDDEVDALITLLDSPSAPVRRAAARLLGHASDPGVAGALVVHAADADKNVGNAIAGSLGELAARFGDAQKVLSENVVHPTARAAGLRGAFTLA